MGDEVKCGARINRRKDDGKALLETNELVFRGAECRVKIVFSDIKSVTAADGELRIKTKDGAFAFAVGSAAEKWRRKILHPKTRVEKLGVKAGMRLTVLGDAEGAFAKELKQSKAEIRNGSAEASAELVFWFLYEK